MFSRRIWSLKTRHSPFSAVRRQRIASLCIEKAKDSASDFLMFSPFPSDIYVPCETSPWFISKEIHCAEDTAYGILLGHSVCNQCRCSTLIVSVSSLSCIVLPHHSSFFVPSDPFFLYFFFTCSNFYIPTLG